MITRIKLKFKYMYLRRKVKQRQRDRQKAKQFVDDFVSIVEFVSLADDVLSYAQKKYNSKKGKNII